MIDASDPDTVIGLRDRIALVLGLALMGRRSELVALELDDLTETLDWHRAPERSTRTRHACSRRHVEQRDPKRAPNLQLTRHDMPEQVPDERGDLRCVPE